MRVGPYLSRFRAFALSRSHSLSRRDLLGLAAGTALGLLAAKPARAYGGRTYFTWVQLRYPGSWDPTPRAAPAFLEALRRRTSVEPGRSRLVIDVGSPDLFLHPLLYVAGRGSFPRLDSGAEGWLRRYLEHGGAVLFDDATGIADSGFAEGAGEFLGRVFPGRSLAPLPADHTIFQSFYLLRGVPGRKIVSPFLYGIDIEDLTPILFCPNDLGGAWDKDPLGGFTYPCTPGGERQREMTFRMGINWVMYALTGNYKKDQVHIPFILKRRHR